jgi:RHS repeat-associated protein
MAQSNTGILDIDQYSEQAAYAAGQRVKQTLNGVTTTFVGETYEITGAAVTKHYHAGAQIVAYRDSGTLRYVIGDHLGSSTVTADVNGGNVTRQLFKAWGETRSSGSLGTKYQYTGQFSYTVDFGLHFFRARFYDPTIGRFASADTVIPGRPRNVLLMAAYYESEFLYQVNRYNSGDAKIRRELSHLPTDSISFDRLAFANNNPVYFIDVSGHDGVSYTLSLTQAAQAVALLGTTIDNMRQTGTNWMVAGGLIGSAIGAMASAACGPGAFVCVGGTTFVGGLIGVGIGYVAGGGLTPNQLEDVQNLIGRAAAFAAEGETEIKLTTLKMKNGDYRVGTMINGEYEEVIISDETYWDLKHIFGDIPGLEPQKVEADEY